MDNSGVSTRIIGEGRSEGNIKREEIKVGIVVPLQSIDVPGGLVGGPRAY